MLLNRTNFFGIDFRICLDQIRNSNASGRLYSRRLTDVIKFDDLIHLFLLLDELMDRQQFPQAFKDLRTFSTGRKHLPDGLCADSLASGMPEEAVSQASGDCATLSFYVESRRNATWQGQINLLDGNPPISFCSAMEMLYVLEQKVFMAEEPSAP